MIESAAESPSNSRITAVPSAIVHIDAPGNGIIASPATPIHGWLAVEGQCLLEQVCLANGRGKVVSLETFARADVCAATPGKSSVGFRGWIDIRTAADGPWNIQYLVDGTRMETASGLAADPAAVATFVAAKADKLERVRQLIRCPFCRTELETDATTMRCANGHIFPTSEDAFDFLDEDIRQRVGAFKTTNVSDHGYDETLLELISNSAGPILDVGAGLRPTYRDDVINFEIVPYPTTDVVGASEYLPFADDTFDLLISVAVLEHVRDPFAAARELQRVLKPGGRIFAAVPFLQPYHGYPDHYYNMTAGGLRNLFADLEVERLDVPRSGGPIFALTWILQSWRRALPPETAAEFDKLSVADLAVDPISLINSAFVRELTTEANVELAALNVLVGRKPK